MIFSAMKGLSISATVETPLNLLVTVSSNGGNNWGNSPMHTLNQFCFYVMVAVAIAQTITSLRRIYKSWQMKLGLKLESPITHPIPPNTTPLSIAYFPISLELVMELFLPVLSW
jgi:hypothetical protein